MVFSGCSRVSSSGEKAEKQVGAPCGKFAGITSLVVLEPAGSTFRENLEKHTCFRVSQAGHSVGALAIESTHTEPQGVVYVARLFDRRGNQIWRAIESTHREAPEGQTKDITPAEAQLALLSELNQDACRCP
jgi:hypothetical protein